MEFIIFFFFFQAEDGIRDLTVTGVQTCALPISSRRRHTRFDCDWSSDVCSSDLYAPKAISKHLARHFGGLDRTASRWVRVRMGSGIRQRSTALAETGARPARSEERRVGKECRSRWSPYH